MRSGVHVAFVHVIVDALLQAASKARRRGWIGDFDFEDCAAATDIPVEQVAAVCRVLTDIGWLAQEHIIDWPDRQPDQEDPTATERQRTKRAKDRARRAVAMGTARPEDLQLLSTDEQEMLSKLSKVSRVTAEAPAAPVPTLVAPISWFEPADDSTEAEKVAQTNNEHIARQWLFGSGGTDFGPASKIVADNFGCNRFSAHDMVIRWSRDLAGDSVTLAKIIDGAEQHALNADAFQNVVRQRIADAVKVKENGPTLPLGIGAIRGGRANG